MSDKKKPPKLRLLTKSESHETLHLESIVVNSEKRKSLPPIPDVAEVKHESSIKITKTKNCCSERDSPPTMRKSKKKSHFKSPLSQTMTIIFLLIIALANAQTPEFSICHNEHQFSRRNLHDFMHAKRQTKDVVGLLFEWCSSSPLCADAYHIGTGKTKKDEASFRYIAKHWLQMGDGSVDLFRPFNETVCENETFDDLLKTLWVVAMRLHVKETIRLECGANEKVVFDSETQQMHCVCIADRNCLDSSVWRASSLNWSNVTTTIAAIVLIVVACQMFLTSMQKRHTYHRLFLECKQKCGARDEFIKNL